MAKKLFDPMHHKAPKPSAKTLKAAAKREAELAKIPGTAQHAQAQKADASAKAEADAEAKKKADADAKKKADADAKKKAGGSGG